MQLIADIAVFAVALIHILFMVLEMILWDRATGQRILGFTADFTRMTRTLAANQGLYNGFLAAGLMWSLLEVRFAWNLQVFFLGCVIIAGIFGGATTNRMIIIVQTLPGMIALILVLLAQSTI